MRNVFAFFYRIRAEILFAGLLMLCFIALFRSNPLQRAAIAKSTANITGGIYDVKANFTSYLNLREENKKLNSRLIELQRKSKQNFDVIPSSQFEVRDTLYNQLYLFKSAEVINSTINRPRNTLTINRGRNHGIQIGDGVFSSGGAVGVVTQVSDIYSLVMPIINNQYTASVEIEGKGFFGLLKWDGNNPKIATIYDMADYADVYLGDEVITRGASAIYPRGLLVGYVSDIQREPALGQITVKVLLSVDFASLRQVQVVSHIYRDEIYQLERE
ncbi:MAG: rod shape-determining protein MreC [Luteibaculum sp.]